MTLQQAQSGSSTFTLKCTSTGSPPTIVIWMKDGTLLENNGIYQMFQILRNGTTATYDNYLLVNSTSSTLPGTYSCTIANLLGTSTTDILTIQGTHNHVPYVQN